MKRNLIGILSLVVLPLLLNATGAYAQSAVQGNVPFAFKVGQTQLPVGTYRIKAESTNNTIMIQNCATGKTVMSPAQQEYPRTTASKLVFHHLGNQYFLTQIFGAAGSTGMSLPASKLERELQVASGPSNASPEVMIALN